MSNNTEQDDELWSGKNRYDKLPPPGFEVAQNINEQMCRQGGKVIVVVHAREQFIKWLELPCHRWTCVQCMNQRRSEILCDGNFYLAHLLRREESLYLLETALLLNENFRDACTSRIRNRKAGSLNISRTDSPCIIANKPFTGGRMPLPVTEEQLVTTAQRINELQRAWRYPGVTHIQFAGYWQPESSYRKLMSKLQEGELEINGDDALRQLGEINGRYKEEAEMGGMFAEKEIKQTASQLSKQATIPAQHTRTLIFKDCQFTLATFRRVQESIGGHEHLNQEYGAPQGASFDEFRRSFARECYRLGYPRRGSFAPQKEHPE